MRGKEILPILLKRCLMLAKIVEAVVSAVQPDKVILFGSQARGTAGESSDYDLLVIGTWQENRGSLRQKVRMALPTELVQGVDILFAHPEKMQADWLLGDPVLREAVETGVTVYEHA